MHHGGTKEKTQTGMKKTDLIMNKRGKVVSKAASAAVRPQHTTVVQQRSTGRKEEGEVVAKEEPKDWALGHGDKHQQGV